MPKVQAPDANPLASRASEPEARVEGSSFHAKTPWLRPGGKSNGTGETRLRPGSQFAEIASSQSLTQFDSVTWHVTRASLNPVSLRERWPWAERVALGWGTNLAR